MAPRLPLVTFLLFAAALAAHAQGVLDPKKDYESKYRKQAQAAAREHVTLAKFCAGKKLFAAANSEYRRALSLDPDSTDARKGLNWKHDGKAWVPDPANPPKAANEGAPDAVNKGLDDYGAKRQAMATKMAKEFQEVALWGAKKNLKVEARTAWRQVLYYDEYSVEAREGMGWAREDGNWISPEDGDRRAALAKQIAEASAGEAVGEASAVEQKTGWRLAKRRSKHFQFEGLYADAEIAALVKVAEAARALFLEQFEMKEEDAADPIGGVFLRTKEEHDQFLQRFAELKGRELDEERAMSGWTDLSPMIFEVRQGDHDPAFFKDWAVHCVVEFLLVLKTDGAKLPAWLGEGIPYWFTYFLTKSADTNCINFETMGDSQDDWDNALEWKEKIKRLVIEGRDAPAREVCEARLNALDGPKGVKGWSITEWLMATRRKELLKFLELLAGGTAQEEAVKSAFRVTGYAELDGLWREYVKETY